MHSGYGSVVNLLEALLINWLLSFGIGKQLRTSCHIRLQSPGGLFQSLLAAAD